MKKLTKPSLAPRIVDSLSQITGGEAREGRNPRTGKEIDIAPSTTIKTTTTTTTTTAP